MGNLFNKGNKIFSPLILKRRGLLLIFAIHILVIVTLYFIFWGILTKRFDSLEDNFAINVVEDINNKLNNEINHLDNIVKEWAIWTDLYDYVDDRNEKFYINNLQDTTQELLNVDIIAIVNNKDEIVLSRHPDYKGAKFSPVYSEIKSFLNERNKTVKLENNDKGIITFNKKHYIFSVYPILKSDFSGPRRGALMMARVIDKKFIDRIKVNDVKSIKIIDNKQIDIPVNFYVVPGLSGQVSVNLTNSNYVLAYYQVLNYFERPAFNFKIIISRDIYKQSKQSVNFIVIFLLFLTLVFDAVTFFVLEKRVLLRFEKVNDIINTIKKSENLPMTTDVVNKDELTRLASAIQNILRLLKESKEAHKAIYQGVVDGIIIVDKKTQNIVNVNSIICSLTGYIEEELLSQKLYNVISLEDYEFILNKFAHNNKSSSVSKNIRIKKNDKTYFYSDFASSFINFKGASCMLCVIRDVTEKKLIEDELEDKRNNLEKLVDEQTAELRDSYKKLKEINIQLLEANNHKDRFLQTMSHELRTPLNAILGFTTFLKQQFFGPLNERQMEYVKLIDDAGKHLLALIEDILNITQIDRGLMDFKPEKINVDECFDEAVSLVQNSADKKNITIEKNYSSEVKTLFADKRKAKQILINVLSNAIKFSEKQSSIKIEVEKLSDFAKISVIDHGMGIKQEDLENIFQEFYQTDQVKKLAIGGTGVGLALTKRLIEMHDCEIGVESVYGEGSTFWFTLPLYLNN